LAGLEPRSGEVEFHSTVSGGRLEGSELDGRYWYRNLRERVRLESAVRGLAGEGYGVLVEVSPHPVLTMGVESTLERAGVEGQVVGAVGRGAGGMGRWLGAVSELEVSGAGVDWGRVYGRGEMAELPTYAFQRRRYWATGDVGGGEASRLGLEESGHPLLGAV